MGEKWETRRNLRQEMGLNKRQDKKHHFSTKRQKETGKKQEKQGHGPGNLTGNLQAVKGNLENLWKIDAELQVERQNPVKMVKKYHFRVVLT